MPTFKSVSELNKAILSKSCVAVEVAKKEAYKIIDNVLEKYYAWEPEYYKRTRKLLNSLVESKVKVSGNSVVAEVYFDSSKLTYKQGLVPLKKPFPDGTTHGYATWDAGKVLNAAMHGSDAPTWRNPTEIWDESAPILDRDMMNILIKELKKAGIPIK